MSIQDTIVASLRVHLRALIIETGIIIRHISLAFHFVIAVLIRDVYRHVRSKITALCTHYICDVLTIDEHAKLLLVKMKLGTG